ncbi:MAG: MarR family transcriptional regulator [Haliscomenobacter sp.]|nr:MarR family transcriptional regulator [Haliscomenobacter sp.]MBP9076127.1 MarR family transcriptional regulator [Haliscomenobacter sp.]
MQSKSIPDQKTETSGYVLERTARLLKLALQQRLAKAGAGITVDQWVLLQEIRQQPGIAQLELARATFKDAASVTRILDLLAAKGLVVRLPDLADRRKFLLQLTPAGDRTYSNYLPLIKSFRSEVWRDLSQEDLDRLLGILDKIAANLSTGESLAPDFS